MEKILVGLDGSANSFEALEAAMALAKLCKAELHTISVEGLPDFPESIGEIEEEKSSEDGKYDHYIAKAEEMAAAKDVRLKTHVFTGHEVKTIVEYIKNNRIDLLVVGFMGRSAIYDWVMGRTSQSLVRLSPCSVLVVKHKEPTLI